MKKILALFGVMVSLFFYGQKKTDWQQQNLSGKVKSVKENTYEFVEKQEGMSRGEIILTYQVLFNEKGNRSEEIMSHMGGELFSKYLYKYNDKDQLMAINVDEEGEIFPNEVYQYDNNGNRIETKIYNIEGELLDRTVMKYDHKGNKVKEIWYDANGKSSSKVVCIYNDKNQLIEQIETFAGGEKTLKLTFQYDEKGYLIEQNDYGGIGRKTKKYPLREKFQYDDKGNKIEWIWYKENEPSSKFTYQYTYDKQGNGVIRTEYADGFPNEITERTIEYYP